MALVCSYWRSGFAPERGATSDRTVKQSEMRIDAFLHVSVLKEAGYISVPVGTTMQVRVEPERGRQRIVEVLSVDTRTANPGEPPPVVRKQPVKRPVGGEGDDES